ncbi:MAG: FeoC-like transcriptional regulator [Gammaproteobacteria bacterium]|nr:FeoC-like transcriptional regulator [Gammaproteobacteria bacterium]
MLLQQVKQYLMQRHVVSLMDLKREFKSDSDVLRDMLQLWIAKGKVRCLQKTPACGVRCTQCDPLLTELYEWIEAEKSAQKIANIAIEVIPTANI